MARLCQQEPRLWTPQTLQPTQVSSQASWLANFQVAGPEYEAGRDLACWEKGPFCPTKSVPAALPSRSPQRACHNSDSEQQARTHVERPLLWGHRTKASRTKEAELPVPSWRSPSWHGHPALAPRPARVSWDPSAFPNRFPKRECPKASPSQGSRWPWMPGKLVHLWLVSGWGVNHSFLLFIVPSKPKSLVFGATPGTLPQRGPVRLGVLGAGPSLGSGAGQLSLPAVLCCAA